MELQRLRIENQSMHLQLATLGRCCFLSKSRDFIHNFIFIIVYNYNPCRTFSLPEPCQNVAACQCEHSNEVHAYSLDFLPFFFFLANAEERAFYLLGRQESALWSPGNDNGADPTVTYSGDLRKAIVILVCSTNGSEEFEVVGEEPAYTYTFRLTSKCACWNGCTCQGSI